MKKLMAQIEYITVKNASRATRKRLRQIGIEKAKRLQLVQERWDNGEFRDNQMVVV